MHATLTDTVVCGDDPLVAAALVRSLDQAPDFRARLWDNARRGERADVALVVTSCPPAPGPPPWAAHPLPQPRVLLAPRRTPTAVLHAIASGARTLMTHAQLESPEELVRALTAAARGEPLLDPRAYLLAFPAAVRWAESGKSRTAGAAPIRLTERELEIGCALIYPCDYRRIAAAHGVTEATVNFHVAALRRKTGLKNRQELAEYFLQDLPCLTPGVVTMPISRG